MASVQMEWLRRCNARSFSTSSSWTSRLAFFSFFNWCSVVRPWFAENQAILSAWMHRRRHFSKRCARARQTCIRPSVITSIRFALDSGSGWQSVGHGHTSLAGAYRCHQRVHPRGWARVSSAGCTVAAPDRCLDHQCKKSLLNYYFLIFRNYRRKHWFYMSLLSAQILRTLGLVEDSTVIGFPFGAQVALSWNKNNNNNNNNNIIIELTFL
jgi:hypothetical protein